jgi:hypothetical protein
VGGGAGEERRFIVAVFRVVAAFGLIACLEWLLIGRSQGPVKWVAVALLSAGVLAVVFARRRPSRLRPDELKALRRRQLDPGRASRHGPAYLALALFMANGVLVFLSFYAGGGHFRSAGTADPTHVLVFGGILLGVAAALGVVIVGSGGSRQTAFGSFGPEPVYPFVVRDGFDARAVINCEALASVLARRLNAALSPTVVVSAYGEHLVLVPSPELELWGRRQQVSLELDRFRLEPAAEAVVLTARQALREVQMGVFQLTGMRWPVRSGSDDVRRMLKVTAPVPAVAAADGVVVMSWRDDVGVVVGLDPFSIEEVLFEEEPELEPEAEPEPQSLN